MLLRSSRSCIRELLATGMSLSDLGADMIVPG
jgi:hypothetical protein